MALQMDLIDVLAGKSIFLLGLLVVKTRIALS